jgi:hypothetical protein
MPKKTWTDPLEQLLITWAEKASGYAWLHQKSSIVFKKKNLCLSIPASIFGYVAGISVLLSNDVFSDCSHISNGPAIRGLIGITAISAGILSNFQEMFTFKEEAEKHRIAALRFLSFFREISCELSLDPKYRSAPMDYITLKRFEFDKILEQSPDIPECIISQFNKKFKNLSIHKPDAVIGLQTILPFGKQYRVELTRSLSIRDKILLLRCFNSWKKDQSVKYRKPRKVSDDVLIEVTNSRTSNMDLVEVENGNVELTERNAEHLLLHGTLSEQKRFVQNQNIKIKQNPLESDSSTDLGSGDSEETKRIIY